MKRNEIAGLSMRATCSRALLGCASLMLTTAAAQATISIQKIACPEIICEGVSTPVTYTYFVTTVQGAFVTNVVVTDDTCGPGGPNTPLALVSGDTNNNGTLEFGELWVYSCTTNLSQATHNTATVSGLVNGSSTETATDEADVFAIRALSFPAVCGTEFCARLMDYTGAAVDCDCSWTGPNGQPVSSVPCGNNPTGCCCITLDANDLPGNYRVTFNCGGNSPCPGGGPVMGSCEVTFSPPGGPSCTISAGPCPFPRTLTANASNCPNCTYQWGIADAAHTVCTPLAGETGSTFSAAGPGNYCVTVSDGAGCSSTCYVLVEDCPGGGGEGRTPGFWKQTHHFGHWPAPYCPSNDCPCGPATLFCDVFDCASGCAAAQSAYNGKTLLQVLSQGGGGFKALGRHAVAALLNSAHNSIDYLYSTSEVIAMTNQAMASCNPEPTKNLFEAQNELGGGSLGGQLFCTSVLAGYGSAWPDFNNDGRINGQDMSILLSHWGPYSGPCDLHKNNKINNKDVVIMTYLLSLYSE